MQNKSVQQDNVIGFIIVNHSGNGRKELALLCETVAQRNIWISMVQSAIDECSEMPKNSAPVVIPNKQTKVTRG